MEVMLNWVGGGVLLLGPGGEVAAFEVGGSLRRLLPGGGGADFGTEPQFLGRGKKVTLLVTI